MKKKIKQPEVNQTDQPPQLHFYNPSPDGMYMQLAEVTPAWSSYMLEHRNKGNRKIGKAHVNDLASAIITKKMRLTHQPIAIGENGNLIDGQHRLTAIVNTGISIRSWIAFNVPSNTQLYIDIGRLRKATELIHFINQYRIDFPDAKLAQMADGEDRMIRALVDPTSCKRTPNYNLLAYWQKYQDMVKTVGQWFLPANGLPGISRIGVKGAVLAAAINMPGHVKHVKHFTHMLITGDSSNEPDCPVMSLRRFLTDVTPGASGSGNYRKSYLQTEQAIHNYIHNVKDAMVATPTVRRYSVPDLTAVVIDNFCP